MNLLGVAGTGQTYRTDRPKLKSIPEKGMILEYAF